jgi:hypothetical protein
VGHHRIQPGRHGRQRVHGTARPQRALTWRLKDFKRGLGLGNPRRERGKLAPWAVSGSAPDSGGIMDHLFVTTGTVIADRWQENAHAGDMFADNGTDAASHDKTLIAKVITEGTFSSVAGALLKVMTCS